MLDESTSPPNKQKFSHLDFWAHMFTGLAVILLADAGRWIMAAMMTVPAAYYARHIAWVFMDELEKP